MMRRLRPLPQGSRSNPRRQVRRQLNLRLLPFVVAILAFLYVLTGFKGWLIFFIGTAGAWLIAWLWIFSLERNLWVERTIHLAWATVGESVPEQVRLVNTGWLPAIWVEIKDETEMLESPLRLVSDVGQRGAHNRNLSHLFTRRGVYTLGPTHLRSGDPFGIYTLSMQDQHSSTILVTPPVLPLSYIKIPNGGWTGDERYRRGFYERNISTTGLRNYVPGDSLRRIHWRASAHFDSLIVRQQEAAAARDWWIFLDLDRDAQAGSGMRSTIELSIVIAASLAVRGLREYRKVGLALAGPKPITLEPGSDPSQGWRILRALATAQAGPYKLANLIRQRRSNQGSTDILITSCANPAWVAAAERHFQAGNTIALLVNAQDFGAPEDIRKVIPALARSRIPFIQLPVSLLDQAYSSDKISDHHKLRSTDTLKRYLQQGRQAWQSMD
jgi:uncharacterized protein (DUF58 family)